jgi:putative Ca2+/H+ antiporter (TMEM165/GDT1 family)
VGDILVTVGVAFATIFVAELGDKSQLLTLALATRLRPIPLLVGLGLAIALLCGLAVVVGGLLGLTVPERPVTIIAGVLFIAFGLWTLRPEPGAAAHEEEIAARAVDRSQRSQLLTALGAFFFAELGDKTQLATLTLAAGRNPLAVWAGATLGFFAATALALVIGRALGARLPERPIRLAAAALFLAFGLFLLVDGIRG